MFTIGEELQRRAAVDRAGRTMGIRAGKLLRRTFAEVARELQRTDLSLSRRAELSAFLGRTSATLGAQYQRVAAEQLEWARTVAKGAGENTLAAMERMLGQQAQVLLTAERVDAIVALPIMDLPLGDWWRREAADLSTRVKTLIQQGLLQGLSMRDIAKRIAGNATTPNAYRVALARAMTVSRTTASAVATHADNAVFSALGPGITDRYTYRATLDGRTSVACRSADGRVFRYGEAGALQPPLHPNCRSTIIPLLNVKNLTPAQRAKVAEFYGTDGRLPPTRTVKMYDDWLKAQRPKVREAILGKDVAARWAAGELSLPDALAASRNAFATYDDFVAALPPIAAPAVPAAPAAPTPTPVAPPVAVAADVNSVPWQDRAWDTLLDQDYRGLSTDVARAQFMKDVEALVGRHVPVTVGWNDDSYAHLRWAAFHSPPKTAGARGYIGMGRDATKDIDRWLAMAPAERREVIERAMAVGSDGARFATQREFSGPFNAVHMAIHEYNHAASGVTLDRDYARMTPLNWTTSTALEEGMVELRARRAVARMVGMDPDDLFDNVRTQRQFDADWKTMKGKKWGAYQDFVQATTRMERVLGKDAVERLYHAPTRLGRAEMLRDMTVDWAVDVARTMLGGDTAALEQLRQKMRLELYPSPEDPWQASGPLSIINRLHTLRTEFDQDPWLAKNRLRTYLGRTHGINFP